MEKEPVCASEQTRDIEPSRGFVTGRAIRIKFLCKKPEKKVAGWEGQLKGSESVLFRADLAWFCHGGGGVGKSRAKREAI